MPRTQQINHNGKTIYFMDFSGLRDVHEIKGVITQSVAHIRSKPSQSVFTLTNIKDMHFSSEIKEMFTDFVKGNKPFVKAGAVVGLNGLQQIIYNGMMKITGRDIKSYNTLDSAKDWLANKK